jgi:hypothetical protein
LTCGKGPPPHLTPPAPQPLLTKFSVIEIPNFEQIFFIFNGKVEEIVTDGFGLVVFLEK